MRYFFLNVAGLCLLLLGVLPLPLHADSDGCNEYSPTLMDVQPQFDDVDYEFYTPMLQIKELSSGTKNGGKGEQWPVGLSTGEMFFRVTTDVMKIRSNYGQLTCGQVKAIHISFGFKDNKIYVAKEFPRRSCPFKTVLAHEEKHKAVDRALLEEYLEKSKNVLFEEAKKIGVVKAPSPMTVDELINRAISEKVDLIGKELDQEHQMRQEKIDSAEEYQRVTDSCEGLTMEIVHDRLEMLEASQPGITKVSHPASPSGTP